MCRRYYYRNRNVIYLRGMPRPPPPPIVGVKRRGHLLVILECPFCGARAGTRKQHVHGTGGPPGIGRPRRNYGHRQAHCVRPFDPEEAERGYLLIEVCEPEVSPTPPPGSSPVLISAPNARPPRR